MDSRILSKDGYLHLCDGARLIKRDKRQLQILHTPYNEVIKFIYKPRLALPKKILNETRRFLENAKLLKKHEIPCPNIIAVYHYPGLKCDILVYDYITGHSLYDLASRNDITKLSLLPNLISKLHNVGLYFGDFHLGNIIYNGNNLSLIDIESIKYKGRPLNDKERLSNLKYMLSLKRDIPIYKQFGIDDFLNEYLSLSKTSYGMNEAIGFQIKQKLYQGNSEIISEHNPL